MALVHMLSKQERTCAPWSTFERGASCVHNTAVLSLKAHGRTRLLVVNSTFVGESLRRLTRCELWNLLSHAHTSATIRLMRVHD